MGSGAGLLSVVGFAAGAGACVGCPGVVGTSGAKVSCDGTVGTANVGCVTGSGGTSPGRSMGAGTSIGRWAGVGKGAMVPPMKDGKLNAGEVGGVGAVGAGRNDGKSNPAVGELTVGIGTTTGLAKGAGVMGGSVCRVVESSKVMSTTTLVLRF